MVFKTNESPSVIFVVSVCLSAWCLASNNSSSSRKGPLVAVQLVHGATRCVYLLTLLVAAFTLRRPQNKEGPHCNACVHFQAGQQQQGGFGQGSGPGQCQPPVGLWVMTVCNSHINQQTDVLRQKCWRIEACWMDAHRRLC